MASNSLGHLAGNFLQAFTQSKLSRERQTEEAKERKLRAQLYEIELKRHQQQQAATEKIGRVLDVGSRLAPIPQYREAPDGLGLEQTGSKPSAFLLSALADPQNYLTAHQAGVLPALEAMGRNQAREAFISGGMKIEDAIKTPEGQASLMRAGMSPQDVMNAGFNFKPTANIQDFTFAQENPAFAEFLNDQGAGQIVTIGNVPHVFNRRTKTLEPVSTLREETDSRAALAGAEATGKWQGEMYNAIQDAGLGASGRLARLDRMESLLSRFETGRTEGLQKAIAEFASELGIDVAGLGEQQAFEALANQMALELRNPSGGAGMPGALSNQDREFLVSMIPRLRNTPEGNRQIIEFSRRLAQRDREVADLARTYKGQHGSLDERFLNELAQWSGQHPLFVGGGAPAPGRPNGSATVNWGDLR